MGFEEDAVTGGLTDRARGADRWAALKSVHAIGIRSARLVHGSRDIS